ncbi:MAG TPA: protein kinase, partial [Candidatus Acidoferrales bacterium]|nr:protein kinase [Candidatus Acidoferrales bacterium]
MGELGRGAMGVVYRGKDPFIGRTVAIKTITGNFTDNPDLLERFYREARAAGALQHPNIVTIYDMGEDSGTPYIAMELLEGDDLSHMVDKERDAGGQNALPASIKLNYIVQVCRALEYAHKRNIVHRDIKPGNIVVTHEGAVKVVDFGIARLTDTSSTSSGMLIGTIDYMSPEQIRGEKVDGRSDIWAVGVMMYEILTYTKPFMGGNITAVMFAIVSQEPKSIRDHRPDLPTELDDVVRRIFRKEPGERYQSMEELLNELEPVARKMQQESVGDLVNQGENMLKSGELQRAKELLKQALVLDTSHLHAKTLLDKVNSEIRRSEVLPKLNDFVAIAEKHLQEGHLEDARREADAALHLDSNFMPARELLGKVQEAAMQLQLVQAGMREARQRLAEGSLTEAEQSLEKVLKAAPDNDDARSLRSQITEEKERRGKRKQLTEGVQRARQLWTAQQYDEALKVLDELERSHPGESEVAKLLDAVRADKSQDEIQKSLAEARKLLGAQSFNDALGTLDGLLQRYPTESAAVKLRELVLQERGEHSRQLRLQKELDSLKKLVADEKFDDAIGNGEGLLKEFPEDFELSRLVEFARTQRTQQDLLRRRQARNQEINNQVQAGNFDAAVTACQEALKEFPSDAEFKQRLEQTTTQQKESKNRERQKLLDDRLRTMRQSIERGDLTGAIDLGNRTVVQTGKDTDLTKLIEIAKQERSSRDQQRNHDEQALKAIDLLENKKFDEAAKILRVLERGDIIDERVPVLLRAAEDRRVPSREELTLMRSKPVGRPEGETGTDKTRIGSIGGGGKPSPAPAPTPTQDAGGGGATRVFRPEIGEETVKF